MNANPKDGFSVSLSKFHRKSLHSQMANTSGCNQLNDLPNIPLPELKVRGLQSAKIKASPKRSPHILKFYVHDAQCILNDPIKKANRRYENQSEYVFVDTYLDALHVIAQEEKKYKQGNGQTIQSEEFSEQQISINPQPTLPNLPAQLMRERMRVYAQSQQKEPQSIESQLAQRQPKKVIKTATSLMTKKILPNKLTVSLSVHQAIPSIKHKVSAKRWVMFTKQKNEKCFNKSVGWQEFQKGEVASITKIMTCYTTLTYLKEYNIEPDQIKIKIPGHAECIDGTSAFLNAGGILTIKQLLFALMLPSGNDAALVLSFTIAYLMILQKTEIYQYNRYLKGAIIDIEPQIERNKKLLKHTFLDQMNKHAISIKMENTNYSSVHGLNDEKNVSCPNDISKLIEKCIQLEVFLEIITTKIFKTHALTDKGGKATLYKWKNTNKLLKKSGWMGVKTGVTPNAGPCFTGYYKNNDMEAIIVVLNCSSMNQRFRDAEVLLISALK
ncbi:unnamed protein product [Paramecium pentaurelia]|uniref:Peptidase S11 D-alanyl-D-alanine carboxypeptidase A N-terminal domain-containing protein n=1 Tax=Paramecium pentaurelia TaxID=43138 RepID=A0A8S1XY91_9CILI|nr:unnamed protein product [Paramecium pentaurelia]